MFDVETLKDPRKRRWVKMSRIPRNYWGKEVKDLDPYDHDSDVRGGVREWMDDVWAGKVIGADAVGLCLIGLPGHGKTSLALAVVQELVVRTKSSAIVDVWKPKNPHAIGALKRPIYFGYYPEVLATAKAAMSQDEDAVWLENALFGRSKDPDEHVRILVLDDLGKEHKTTSRWAENYFDHLLRTRYYNGLPTIVTSNVDRRQWAAAYGPAMDSFAYEALATYPIASPTNDRRKV